MSSIKGEIKKAAVSEIREFKSEKVDVSKFTLKNHKAEMIQSLRDLMNRVRGTDAEDGLSGERIGPYSMVIYVDTLEDAWTMPYVPAGALEIEESQSTEGFDSPNASYSIPGVVQPTTLKWSGVLPCTSRSFCCADYRADPRGFREWINSKRQAFCVFDVIITDDYGAKVIKAKYIITKASFKPKQNGDYTTELEFELCRPIGKEIWTLTR